MNCIFPTALILSILLEKYEFMNFNNSSVNYIPIQLIHIKIGKDLAFTYSLNLPHGRLQVQVYLVVKSARTCPTLVPPNWITKGSALCSIFISKWQVVLSQAKLLSISYLHVLKRGPVLSSI